MVGRRTIVMCTTKLLVAFLTSGKVESLAMKMKMPVLALSASLLLPFSYPALPHLQLLTMQGL